MSWLKRFVQALLYQQIDIAEIDLITPQVCEVEQRQQCSEVTKTVDVQEECTTVQENVCEVKIVLENEEQCQLVNDEECGVVNDLVCSIVNEKQCEPSTEVEQECTDVIETVCDEVDDEAQSLAQGENCVVRFKLECSIETRLANRQEF